MRQDETERVNIAAFEEGEATDTLPSVEVARGDLAAGIPAFRLFALAGLAGSNGEARRLIRGGGARINDVPVVDEGLTVTVADLRDDAIKLSAGRKHHRLVRTPWIALERPPRLTGAGFVVPGARPSRRRGQPRNASRNPASDQSMATSCPVPDSVT